MERILEWRGKKNVTQIGPGDVTGRLLACEYIHLDLPQYIAWHEPQIHLYIPRMKFY